MEIPILNQKIRQISSPTTFIMFYVYVIKSKKDDSLYIGFTRDLRKRFSEHNLGLSRYTKSHTPFILVCYEAYSSEKDARIREKRLKKFKNSYTELKKRIINSLEV
jgi:putative endonuclease